MSNMAIREPTANIQQWIKGERSRLIISSSDDDFVMQQIQAIHAPDERDIDVKPILYIAERILIQAAPNGHANVELDPLEDKSYQSGFISMPESSAYTIEQISYEIAGRSLRGGDASSTTITILNQLAGYSWDAKLILSLAAFAVNCGEFWLLAQTCNSNQLAKSVAVLKQLTKIFEHSSPLKRRFDSMKSHLRAMVDIAKCIVKFRELPTQYISTELAALSTALNHIPLAVYWTIRSIVAFASQISILPSLGFDHVIEDWELSTLAHKVSQMHSHLMALLETCNKHIDEKKHYQAFQNLVHLFESIHIDNMKVLKMLIYEKDDVKPLFDGATKKRVDLDVLRRKNVLLLISDLEISPEELDMMEQIYSSSRFSRERQESYYEFVWLPILDPASPLTETKQKQFESLQENMPWHSVYHPSIIQPEVIEFIKKMWNFRKKPILVVLDPEGRVVSLDALPMMWIWGSTAFPFTRLREEALWKDETWKLELLVDAIDPLILNWIAEEKFICLYGGEEMEWIRKFTQAARAMAEAAGISLEMVYVGKSNPKERVRRVTASISTEKISHYWEDLASIWYFWIRIESMLQSKMQLGRSVENDAVMKEIATILSFDSSSNNGWAVLSRGAEMIKAKGDAILRCLQEYDQWKENGKANGILRALGDQLTKLQSPHHCNRLVLPGTTGKLPERMVCSECARVMEMFIMYRCCDE